MNKFTKGILSLGLALSIIVGGAATAFADSKSGSINGYYTTGSSYVTYNSGSAGTSFGSNGSVAVNSTYSYVNVNTLATGSTSRNNGHYKYASVSFSAPKNCRSVKVSSSHSVTAYGQSWSTTTSAIY